MKNLLQQLSGIIGAAIAAACCLGIAAVLSAMGAAGLGFLIHDAYLFPLFVAFVGLTLWVLYRSARSHRKMAPFWLSLIGGLLGAGGLWLMVTGLYPMPWSVYTGISLLVAGTVWDLVNRRKVALRETEVSETPPMEPESVNLGRRTMTGAALSIAAAGVFYGMYKSVDTFASKGEEGEIACWGINACKGTTACSTAFNACTSQNACKGRGYIYVPKKECYAKGGVPLKGSEGDPAKG